MKGQKIYKIVCEVSNRERIFIFTYVQPASDIRVAYRLMRERLRNYYGWRLLQLSFWQRLDDSNLITHYKIY